MARMLRNLSVLLATAVALVSAGGCDRGAPGEAPASSTPAAGAAAGRTVYTTFYPTTYLATRLGGGAVEVVCPLPEGEDPAEWQPDGPTIERYQGAGLIVFNGADFEAWRARVSLPESRVVDSTRPFRGELLRLKGRTHSHGTRGEHTHAGIDGHTWLDPINAKAQAAEIAAAMAKRWPESAAKVEQNLAALRVDLDGLDAKLKAVTPAVTGVVLIASHPAYGYLARRYGWTVHDVDLPPEAAPSDAAWAEVMMKAAGGKAIILFEEAPGEAMRARVAAAPSVRAVVFEPCEAADARGDYLSRMHQNIDRLAAAAGQP